MEELLNTLRCSSSISDFSGRMTGEIVPLSINNIDHIYVINLDSRPDRLQTISESLKQAGIVSWQRWPAVKPTTYTDDMCRQFNIEYAQKESLDVHKYILGALGCKLSHIECIKDAKEKGYQTIMVLEDDCVFNHHAVNRIQQAMLELPENWEIMQLAGNHFNHTYKKHSDNLISITESLTTLAYVMHNRIYDEALDAMKYPCEIDTCYCYNIYKRGHSFCIYPHVCQSITSYSDILGKVMDYHCINKHSI